jgi:hypothetical protein
MSACFYTAKNYTGKNKCYDQGDYSRLEHNDDYDSAKVIGDVVAFLWENPNFEGERLQLNPSNYGTLPGLSNKSSSLKVLPNCNKQEHIWNSKCNTNRDLFPELETLRAEHCNKNSSNAMSEKCLTWCGENRGKCSLMSKQVACNKYGLSGNECTDEKIIDLENRCMQYGLIDTETKTATSSSLYQCNEPGIASMIAECKKYELEGENCISSNLADARVMKQMQDQTDKLTEVLNEQSKLSIQERKERGEKLGQYLQSSTDKATDSIMRLVEANAQQSQAHVNRAESLFKTLSQKETPKRTSNTQTYIIAFIIISLVCLLLLAIVGIMFLGKK